MVERSPDMKKIIICERFALEAVIELKKNKNFAVEYFKPELLSTADALIIRSKFKIDRELLEKTKNLKLIITCTSGFDHIDLKTTEEKKITVMYTPDANIIAAAEHTWALLMACTRQIVSAHKEMKSASWKREPFLGFELENKNLGIVGLGRIGQKVAQFANAFSMKVLAYDPYQTEDVFQKSKALRCSYDEILKKSDILSFHVPATFETQNMFSRSQYEYVDPELILINTSRGSVINEDDLAEALQNKQIKAAALDVFANEPLKKDSKLMKSPNIILTPHLGAFTEEAFLKASMKAAKLVENYFTKNQTENTLPLKNEWGTLSFKERT